MGYTKEMARHFGRLGGLSGKGIKKTFKPEHDAAWRSERARKAVAVRMGPCWRCPDRSDDTCPHCEHVHYPKPKIKTK